MQVLYVHGMGRSPLSGWALLRALKKAGVKPFVFAYCVSLEDFSTITRRLENKIALLAARGDYLLIGHSLGGVLLRAALAGLPEVRRAQRVFLLGSPLHASRLAKKLQHNFLYRLITGDCGQLLACEQRMSAVPPIREPTTAIIGTKPFCLTCTYFAGETNDGVVSLAELSADWLTDQIQVPILHSWLPSRHEVSMAILSRLNL